MDGLRRERVETPQAVGHGGAIVLVGSGPEPRGGDHTNRIPNRAPSPPPGILQRAHPKRPPSPGPRSALPVPVARCQPAPCPLPTDRPAERNLGGGSRTRQAREEKKKKKSIKVISLLLPRDAVLAATRRFCSLSPLPGWGGPRTPSLQVQAEMLKRIRQSGGAVALRPCRSHSAGGAGRGAQHSQAEGSTHPGAPSGHVSSGSIAPSHGL